MSRWNKERNEMTILSVFWKPSGTRIKRGLYRSKSGLINADINASYNILRKEFPFGF